MDVHTMKRDSLSPFSSVLFNPSSLSLYSTPIPPPTVLPLLTLFDAADLLLLSLPLLSQITLHCHLPHTLWIERD